MGVIIFDNLKIEKKLDTDSKSNLFCFLHQCIHLEIQAYYFHISFIESLDLLMSVIKETSN